MSKLYVDTDFYFITIFLLHYKTKEKVNFRFINVSSSFFRKYYCKIIYFIMGVVCKKKKHRRKVCNEDREHDACIRIPLDVLVSMRSLEGIGFKIIYF